MLRKICAKIPIAVVAEVLAEGLAPQMVARCTGLPLETVERLASE